MYQNLYIQVDKWQFIKNMSHILIHGQNGIAFWIGSGIIA